MKKALKIVLTSLLCLLMLSTTAFASQSNLDKATKLVDKANARIEQMIDNAIVDAEGAIEKFDGDQEEVMIQKIVNKLVFTTNKVAEKTFEKAEKLGVEVECELIEVNIGGQTVLIDPIRIIGS